MELNIWKIWTKVEGLYKKQSLSTRSVGRTIFLFLFLNRMDNLISPYAEVLYCTFNANKNKLSEENLAKQLYSVVAPMNYYNCSGLNLDTLLGKDEKLSVVFNRYLDGFDSKTHNILINLGIEKIISDLSSANLLYDITRLIADLDLSENSISTEFLVEVMRNVIRKEPQLVDSSEFVTPQDLNMLMCSILFTDQEENASVYDSTCGTAGSLLSCKDYLSECSISSVNLYGQEFNAEMCALSQALFMMSNLPADNIRQGNTLLEDCFEDQSFDYIISDSPFGTSWKHWEREVKSLQHSKYQAGVPSISDAQLLFMQHNISKLKPNGGRLVMLTNNSALVSGSANSGESEIRKWIIENDLLECIIALPAVLLPRASVNIYLWVINTQKSVERQNKVQLIDATLMKGCIIGNTPKSDLSCSFIHDIAKAYHNFAENSFSKIVPNKEFGYLVLYINQPIRDDNGQLYKGKKSADKKNTVVEKIPMSVDYQKYLNKNVYPFIDKDSWLDIQKSQIGYEIRFGRFFCEESRNSDVILRNLKDSHFELRSLMDEILHVHESNDIVHEDFVKMSNIPWIASYPGDWRESKLKFCGKIIPFSPDYAERNDIIVNRMGKVNWVDRYAIEGNTNNHVNSFLVRADNRICLPEYLFWVLKSDLLSKFGKYYGTGHLVNYSATLLGEMPLLLPSKEEQSRIVSMLNNKMEKIEKAVALMQSELDELKHFKSALLFQNLTSKDPNIF